jgi:hypothetical protein
MPEIVRLSPLISFGAKILYNQIISYFWQKGDDIAWPGQQELANKLSISTREVQNCLNELKEVKLIEIKQVGLGKTNNTYLLEPQAKLLGMRKTDNGSYKPIKKSEVGKRKASSADASHPRKTEVKATPAVKPVEGIIENHKPLALVSLANASPPVKQPKQRKVKIQQELQPVEGVSADASHPLPPKPVTPPNPPEGGCITQPPVVITVKPKPPTTKHTKEELLKLLTELDEKAGITTNAEGFDTHEATLPKGGEEKNENGN